MTTTSAGLPVAAIGGGVAGGIVFIIIIVALILLCIFIAKRHYHTNNTRPITVSAIIPNETSAVPSTGAYKSNTLNEKSIDYQNQSFFPMEQVGIVVSPWV